MPTAALIEEACRKPGVLWIAVAGHEPQLAWYIWQQGCAYVLHGGGEQQLPGLESARTVLVTVRSGDTGGRLVTWPADCSRVDPASENWRQLAPLLVRSRLNSADGQAAVARWAHTSRLTRLTPAGEPVEQPGAMPPDGGHAAPRPTPATTTVPLPWVLGRRRTR